MDSQIAKPAVILVRRSLADSIALSHDESCVTMTVANMTGLQPEDVELIPVRLVADDFHTELDAAQALTAVLDEHQRERACADREMRDLRRLLALAAAALEPHIWAPGDEARIYASITKKLGLQTPIISFPSLTVSGCATAA